MSSPIEVSWSDASDVYLTDEVFLYRVMGRVGGKADNEVELEDCYGLDIVRVSLADLRARRLRVVNPASAGAGSRVSKRLDQATLAPVQGPCQS